jgi:hypothetical protein
MMELDDLKESWHQTGVQKNKNTNIMELIRQKSYGPIAALKREFRKQMLVMALMPFLLITTNLNNINNVFASILFWSYTGLCIAMITFGYVNYQLAGKMEQMDDNLISNLSRQISTLETRLQWKITGLRIALIFFIVLTEVVPGFQHFRMLDKWHELPIATRYGVYAAFLILQYFLSKRVNERKFGRHLSYLKKIVHDAQ